MCKFYSAFSFVIFLMMSCFMFFKLSVEIIVHFNTVSIRKNGQLQQRGISISRAVNGSKQTNMKEMGQHLQHIHAYLCVYMCICVNQRHRQTDRHMHRCQSTRNCFCGIFCCKQCLQDHFRHDETHEHTHTDSQGKNITSQRRHVW